MQVYGPTQSKLSALKESNPTYWQLLLSRSEYSEAQINQELASIEALNARLHSFLTSAYDLLVWENGQPMNHFPTGFASDAHQELSAMLAEIDYLSPSFSQNSHSNSFPVRKWQTEAAGMARQITKIEKFISKIN